MSTNKFDNLNPAQKRALKIEGRKFVMKMLLNGMNFGGLIFMFNLAVVLAALASNSYSGFAVFFVCVIADIILLKMMGKISKEIAQKFKENVNKITEAK